MLQGFYQGLGLADPEAVMRVVDKLDKIGPAGVTAELAPLGVTEAQAKLVLALAEISTPDASFVDACEKLGVTDPLLDEGLAELAAVVEAAGAHAPGLCRAELKIARGLDYYTGTVYETQLAGLERYGSVCSGGRYDNLASSGNDRFPGVGLSIGRDPPAGRAVRRERAVGQPLGADRGAGRGAGRGGSPRRATGSRRSCGRGASRPRCRRARRSSASRSSFADRRGIPYVWFPGAEGARTPSRTSVRATRSRRRPETGHLRRWISIRWWRGLLIRKL